MSKPDNPDNPNIAFSLVDPESPPAQEAMTQYFVDLTPVFGDNFDIGDALVQGLDEMRPPTGAFIVALAGDGQVLGCGGVRGLTGDTAEIKRMWVDARARGTGLGATLLAELEAVCRNTGYQQIMLDTNSFLAPAVNLYEQSGYVATAPFNDNPYADLWYVKQLG